MKPINDWLDRVEHASTFAGDACDDIVRLTRLCRALLEEHEAGAGVRLCQPEHPGDTPWLEAWVTAATVIRATEKANEQR